MSKRDFYEVLGVDKDASDVELKKAYRKASIKFHPDKNPDDKGAEDKFKEAAEAYSVLKDPDKKARYDQYGHAGVGGAAGGGGFGGGGMSMDDIFSQFGDIFGGAFGGGGFGGGSRRRVNRGTNLRIKIKLTLEEIAKGTEKKVKVNKYVSCSSCNGSGAEGHGHSTCSTCRGTGQVTRIVNTMMGQMQTSSTCPQCGGEGQIITNKCKSCHGNGIVKGEETITLNIPAGVSDGMQLSMSGKGNAAARDGVPGDLIILIAEEPHAHLKRDENDLLYDHFISFPDAALGCSIDVPTLQGKARVKIASGTQPGKVLRLKGKGLPSVNGYGRGDLLVSVNVWVPKTLSPTEREAMNKANQSKNFQPEPNSKEQGFLQRMRDYFR
ncbi:MAG: molecular chaperone DnaJ [Bacteroidetes bacterium 4572_77]|nr:MAG: molecular chaperone DnaJ [Bacteroidetes bacterium 4572_77]